MFALSMHFRDEHKKKENAAKQKAKQQQLQAARRQAQEREGQNQEYAQSNNLHPNAQITRSRSPGPDGKEERGERPRSVSPAVQRKTEEAAAAFKRTVKANKARTLQNKPSPATNSGDLTIEDL